MFKFEQDDPKLVEYVKSRLLIKTGTSSGQVSATKFPEIIWKIIISIYNNNNFAQFLWHLDFIKNCRCYFKWLFNWSVREKWKGVKAYVENFRLWSLLILLLYIYAASKEKTTDTEERWVHINLENCNIRIGSWTNQFNSKQIIQILQTLVIDYSSTHSYIVNIS